MSTVTYQGIWVKQRGDDSIISLFCTAAPAKSIESWAKINRTLEEPGAAQRILSKSHVRQIVNFLAASELNTIPTTVTVALPTTGDAYKIKPIESKGSSIDRVVPATLTIQYRKGQHVGTIIDGQHRLKALREFADQDVPIILAIILGADKLECAIQFVVVNNSSKRVPTDLVKAIVSEFSATDRDEFDNRLRAVGITLGKYAEALQVLSDNGHSPFNGKLDWDANRNGERVFKPLALEESLKILQNDLQAPYKLDLDEAVQLLICIWTGIVASWDNATPWTASKLASKAGLVSATEFVVERLNVETESPEFEFSPENLRVFARGLFDKVPARFWFAEWNEKGLDTQAGRSLIKDAISEVRRAVAQRKEDPLAHVTSLKLGSVD